MTTKIRLGLVLKETLKGGSDSANKNQFLIELSEKFDVFREDLRALIDALQAQNIASKQYTETRMRVIKRFAKLAEQSPISINVGSLNVAETNDVDQATQDVEDRPCFLYIYRAAFLHRGAYDETFTSFILEFAKQWERDVVGSVTKALELSEDLRREVDHYQAKVSKLQNERPSLFGKSKEPDPKDVEKLARNKEKLADARAKYESHVQELCALIEEVTDRGWKNMVPILAKLGQSDQSFALNECKFMNKLEAVVAAIKSVGYDSSTVVDTLDVVSLPSLTDDEPSTISSQKEEPSPYIAKESSTIIPTLPPPTIPLAMPPSVPPVVPSSLPDMKTISEDIAGSLDDEKSELNSNELSTGEVIYSEQRAGEPNSHDVGTSFSPRSYMY